MLNKMIYFSNKILGANVCNKMTNSIFYTLYKMRNIKKCKILSNNIKFKNKHRGKRCFILGNGPSLKAQDLSLLENEYVFTVNQITRHKDFEKIKTNYHFWADPIFFKIDEGRKEDIELLNVMKSINTKDNNPICFFPLDQQSFCDKFNLNNELNTAFFKDGLIIEEKFNNKIDFTKFVPGFHTVVQYAISMAIYMGFEEIYIMGCDCTGIVTSISSRIENNFISEYAYTITENEKRRMINRNSIVSLESETNSFYRVLRDYRILKEYCHVLSIKLNNCTEGGVLESIERVKFNNIFNK